MLCQAAPLRPQDQVRTFRYGTVFSTFIATRKVCEIFRYSFSYLNIFLLYVYPVSSARGPALLKENSVLNRSQARAEKPGGPPINSLLGSLSPGYGATPGRYGTPGRLETPQTLSTVSSQAQDLSGQDPLATWVTVFGFPPAAASFVLSQVN